LERCQQRLKALAQFLQGGGSLQHLAELLGLLQIVLGPSPSVGIDDRIAGGREKPSMQSFALGPLGLGPEASDNILNDVLRIYSGWAAPGNKGAES